MATDWKERMERKQISDKFHEQCDIIKAELPRFRVSAEAAEASRQIIGESLQKIRHEKLYRIDYKTLDEATKAEFGVSKTTAYRWMHKADPYQISYLPGGSTNHEVLLETQEVANTDVKEDPVEKRYRSFLDHAHKQLEKLKLRKKMGNNRAAKIAVDLRQAVTNFFKFREEPDREIPPPKAEVCECGMEVLWVTTQKWKRMAVNAERTVAGKFDLKGGLAIYVTNQESQGGDRVPLYQHHPHHKKNGKPEDQLPD